MYIGIIAYISEITSFFFNKIDNLRMTKNIEKYSFFDFSNLKCYIKYSKNIFICKKVNKIKDYLSLQVKKGKKR